MHTTVHYIYVEAWIIFYCSFLIQLSVWPELTSSIPQLASRNQILVLTFLCVLTLTLAGKFALLTGLCFSVLAEHADAATANVVCMLFCILFLLPIFHTCWQLKHYYATISGIKTKIIWQLKLELKLKSKLHNLINISIKNYSHNCKYHWTYVFFSRFLLFLNLGFNNFAVTAKLLYR